MKLFEGLKKKDHLKEARRLKREGPSEGQAEEICSYILDNFLTANWETIRELLYSIAKWGNVRNLDALQPLVHSNYDDTYAVLSELGRATFDMLLRLGLVEEEAERLLSVMVPGMAMMYEGIFWGMHESKYKPSLNLQSEILRRMSIPGAIEPGLVAWFYACTWNWEVPGKNELLERHLGAPGTGRTATKAIECSLAGKYFKLD
jgi:hypothetical protein